MGIGNTGQYHRIGSLVGHDVGFAVHGLSYLYLAAVINLA